MKLQRYFRFLKRFVCTAVLIAITDLHAGKVAVNQASNSVSVIPPPVSTQMSLADARFLVGNLEDGVGFGLYAYDINNSGQVVGNRWVLGVGLSGFIWQNGQYFADFPPTDSNHAFSQECYSINENGDVAGLSLGVSVYDPELSQTTTPTDVAIWHRGSGGWAVTSLPKSVGNGVWIPLGLNSSSQSVGTVNEFVAVQYDSVTSNNLPNPYLNPGGPQSGAAYRINNFGVAVGYVGRSFGNYYSETRQACYWNTAGHHLLPSDGNEAVAFSINDIGQIVGYSNDGSLGAFGFGSPVLWDAGSKISLGQIIGEALDINKYGQIVGWGLNDSYEWRALLWDRLQPIDLNTRIPADSGWILTEARAINDSGMILCEGQYKGTPNFCVLTPYQASLAVDANRDGVIKLTSEDDSDVTTEEKPFRFWLNDDIDRTHVTNNDMFQTTNEQDDLERSPTGKVDWQENRIPCSRDLEDFARLWISTQGLTAAFRPKDGTDQAEADLYLGLQWATEGRMGTPAIKIYPAVETDGGNQYLSVPSVADQQVNFDYAMKDFRDTATPDISLNNVLAGTDFFVIPPRYFARLSDAQHKTFFLFEGVSAGKGQLKLVILKKENGSFMKVGDGPGAWFDLQNIRNLYQTWTVGDNTKPGVHADVTPAFTHSVVSGSPTLPEPATEDENDFVLFVHGWNMKIFEKDRFAETALKRLWWQGYRGRFGAFRWPTYYTRSYSEDDPTDSLGPPLDPRNFDGSELNSWKSASGLLQLLAELKDTYHDASGNSRVRVLAHSHGNIAVSEALRQAASPVVQTYVASQAALAAHCFDKDAPDISGDWQNGHWYLTLIDFLNLKPVRVTTPNVYAYYPGSAGLNRDVQYPTAGQPYMTGALGGEKWVNYYNQSDWALDGWITDQALKPDVGFDYRVQFDLWNLHLYYSFTDDNLSGNPELNIPTNTYKIFSFAAQARSQPLGRQPSVMGLFDGQQASWNAYGDKHPGHSAQFRSSIAQRGDYWKQLLISFALKAAP